MNAETLAYVRYRVALAREAIQVAKSALEDGHLHSAVNRLYYACFYMVSALLLAEGHSSSKHSGVRSLFNRYWIKTGRLPVEMSSLYRDLFNHRQQGDYDDFVDFAPDDVRAWYEQADDYVARVSAQIEGLLTVTPEETPSP